MTNASKQRMSLTVTDVERGLDHMTGAGPVRRFDSWSGTFLH